MPLTGVPWAVDQALTSARMGRRLAYAATGGKEGVVAPADLKVSAVPGASVNIAAGGYVALNRYPNQPSQSYMGAAESVTNIAVAAVGGAARSDAILLRIDDPEYGGTVPADRAVGPYEKFVVVTGVSATLKDATELGLAYPAILLARIDRAANATTVVAGDIKDMRKLAQPRYSSDVFMTQPQSGTPGDVLTQAAFRKFPTNWDAPVVIPDWATHCAIVSEMSAMGATGGSATGSLRSVLSAAPDSVVSASVGYDTTSVTDGNRVNALIALGGAIPAAMRGKSGIVYIDGLKSGGAGTIRIQSGTTILHRVEFFEKIV